jgi:hypothetical protein
MAYEGFAGLQTPEDFLGKLQRDYEVLKSDQYNTDAHFNFYVTALHLLDWKYPDNIPGNKEMKRELTRNNVLLQICSHIANGAKHFVASASRHRLVSGVNPGGLLLANPRTDTGHRLPTRAPGVGTGVATLGSD